jgi:hypothetical protein
MIYSPGNLPLALSGSVYQTSDKELSNHDFSLLLLNIGIQIVFAFGFDEISYVSVLLATLKCGKSFVSKTLCWRRLTSCAILPFTEKHNKVNELERKVKRKRKQ